MKKDKEMLEVEQKVKVKKSMDELSIFIDDAEKKKQELLVKAKKAKVAGDARNYKLACMGLNNVLTNKNKAEQMLLTMDIVSSMKDISKMTVGFLDCMQTMCTELGSIAKNNKFGKVVKGFNKAMAAVEFQNQGLDALMEDTGASMDAFDVGFSSDVQREIDAMVDNEIATNESSFDDALEEKIKKLKNGIKG
ncbi:MAG: hypothetical protein FWD32_01605 [Firmicutes bacterium]|nr:hypothetical protein [Bacillota bacterium]